MTVQSRFHSILSLYSGMPLGLTRWPPELTTRLSTLAFYWSGLATKVQGAILVKKNKQKQLKYFKILLVSWIIYGFFCFEPPDFDLGHLNFCQSLARMGHQFSKLNGIPDIAYYYNTICDQVPVLFRFLQTNKLRATLQAMPLSFQTKRSVSSRPFLKNTKSTET